MYLFQEDASIFLAPLLSSLCKQVQVINKYTSHNDYTGLYKCHICSYHIKIKCCQMRNIKLMLIGNLSMWNLKINYKNKVVY